MSTTLKKTPVTFLFPAAFIRWMQHIDDIDLLWEYVEQGSETAFATIVDRHLGKVYSVALRHTNNPGHAEEIAQVVFVILAQKARTLRKDTILSSWLYQTARFASVTHLRSEIRRARREEESSMQTLLDQTKSEDTWIHLSPVLDDAMEKLGANDHAAIVLRFFDGKSMKEVADSLSTSEDAAKKRVNRAVEKLRLFFSNRGIAISSAVLTATISAKSVQAAPATLSKAVVPIALAKGATASTSTLTLIKGALKLMAWTKAKTMIVITAATVLTAGTTTFVVKELSHPTMVNFDGHPVSVLAEFDWEKLAAQGRLTGGKVLKLDGKTALKLEEGPNGISMQLLKVEKPPITDMNYAIIGEIKYENVSNAGHLNMWSFFPPLGAGTQEAQYYSYTGGAEPGPMAQLVGDSDWKTFALPLDRTGKTYPTSFSPPMDTSITARPPTRLEIAIFLPSHGTVYLHGLKLVQWK
jgi:RNA polymerase sigma factor (sigma-70 family)